LLLFEDDDHRLDRFGHLVGIAHRPPQAIAQRARAPCSGRRSCSPSLREMPNSRQASLIASPSSKRDTNRRRWSITEHSFHGIDTSRSKAERAPMCPVRNVTYVSDRSDVGQPWPPSVSWARAL